MVGNLIRPIAGVLRCVRAVRGCCRLSSSPPAVICIKLLQDSLLNFFSSFPPLFVSSLLLWFGFLAFQYVFFFQWFYLLFFFKMEFWFYFLGFLTFNSAFFCFSFVCQLAFVCGLIFLLFFFQYQHI